MNKRHAWLLRAFMVLALALSALFCAPKQAAADPAVSGQWAFGPNFPFFPVHLHLLPSGKIMIWPGDGGVSGNDPRVWDPASGSITPLTQPGYDVFCSGHTFLPDGRLFVAGGHIKNNVGLPDASIYDSVANTWTRQPQMNLGRWYPTTQMLPNGDVVVVSGDVDLTTGSNPLPQVWEGATGTWRSLTNAQLKMPLYPYMFLAPNGKVFNAGPSALTRYLDTAGTGTWTSVGNHVYTASTRDYGSAVMYQPGKILSVGGGDPPTAVSEVIDLNVNGTPKWRSVAPMANARRQMNATLLPDGQVLATGGTKGAGFDNSDPGNPIFAAELWNPSTEQWKVMASSANIPRLYHSIAILLPDGRVLSTGGNGYTQTEIYSPPYLFAGPRPSLTSAPANIGKGQSFYVSTPDASSIDTAVWIKTGSVTHTTNMSQGVFRSTSITQASGGITITAPNLTTVPSGYYMLFLMRGGVPSIAKIIRLDTNAANNPVPTLSSISPTSADAQGPAFTLTVNGTNFVAGSRVRWNGADRTTTFVSPTQLTAAIPSTDIATSGTAQVTVFNPTPGGGTSAAKTFTITTGSGNQQNLASLGTIIARVTAPTGGGSKNIEIIRDGIRPAVGSTDSSLQYDTYDGANTSATDWIGYQFASQQTFGKVVFQEGKHFSNGGWFTTLTVQVRQAGNWVNVPGVVSTPTYPGTNNGVNFETYTLTFPSISGDAIRIYGDPGGSDDFISVAELEVYAASNNPVPTLTSINPTSAAAQGPAFTLTVNGTNFVSGSRVRWNGADRTTTFVSATQLTAAIPASDIATSGTAQVTVFNPTPGGGTSAAKTFTITTGSGNQQNLAPLGTIIARVTAPTGGGSKNMEVIRDGIRPPVGSTDSTLQYDTYDGANTSATDWIGYQFASQQTFSKVVFQEGKNFWDGGWFTTLTVQVRQSGNWVNVPGVVSTPAYPGTNNNVNFETYTLTFPSISGDGIRIYGDPGGSADFISVGELEVY